MNTNRTVLALFSSVFLAACIGSASPDAPESNAQAIRASEPAPDLTGTWVFELDKSDVAAAIRQDCSSKPDPKACWSEIATQARREKIRFAPGTDGHAQWSSFEVDSDKGAKTENLFVSMPVDLAADGPGHVLAKVAGPATGKHAAQFEKSNTTQLRLETPDAHTLVMIDSRKGRLVYSKE